MILPDVNLLVYAFREDSPDHKNFRDWLQRCLDSSETLAITDFALSGFLRIVTHPKIFHPVTPWVQALDFVESLRQARMCIRVAPGDFHWDIFTGLCAHIDARGNTIPDAFLAAIAIERGCRLYSADHGFSRFPGLNWAHPLKS